MGKLPAVPAPEVLRGTAYGVAAYLLWGFFPAFFKLVKHVAPLEVVAHRILWSCLFLILLMTLSGAAEAVRKLLREKKKIGLLMVSTIFISVNWGTFIYAVETDRVLESSLGYFINPLFSVFLGFIFLGERLSRGQTVSLLLAATGVLYLALGHGTFPWIALCLAFSFGLYGLVRKKARVDSLNGLLIETALIMPAALGWLIYLKATGQSSFLGGDMETNLLLAASGVLTAVPLIWFNAAALRLRLMTIGFLQYLTPTLHFILAVWVFGETFSRHHLICFALIWGGLAIYSLEGLRLSSRSHNLPPSHSRPMS
ncbi:MAG: EamA family transporter RarD [Desulfuromonadaceae bacterium]|nr:EamA family transporter RarD [Desulfuromonadaceae bacterium]